MARNFTVQITLDNILNGCPDNAVHCPIALALWPIVSAEGYINLYVSPYAVRLEGEGYRGYATLPTNARQFIKRFDATTHAYFENTPHERNWRAVAFKPLTVKLNFEEFQR